MIRKNTSILLRKKQLLSSTKTTSSINTMNPNTNNTSASSLIQLQPLSFYNSMEKNLLFHEGERALHEKVGIVHYNDMDEMLDRNLEDYFVKFWTSLTYVAVSTIDPVTLLPVLALLVATP